MPKLRTQNINILKHSNAMKKIIVIMLAVMIGLCAASAKGPRNISKHKLCGIWQNCFISMEQNKPVVHFTPYMKVLNSDGSFVNMGIRTDSQCCFIRTMGRWSVESDSVYVEHIDRSITTPGIIGRDNKIHFLLQGDDFVVLKYKIPGNKQWGIEYWVRVIEPDRIEPGSAIPHVTDKDLIDSMTKAFEDEMQPTN